MQDLERAEALDDFLVDLKQRQLGGSRNRAGTRARADVPAGVVDHALVVRRRSPETPALGCVMAPPLSSMASESTLCETEDEVVERFFHSMELRSTCVLTPSRRMPRTYTVRSCDSAAGSSELARQVRPSTGRLSVRNGRALPFEELGICCSGHAVGESRHGPADERARGF
jgi:hypothetical protein